MQWLRIKHDVCRPDSNRGREKNSNFSGLLGVRRLVGALLSMFSSIGSAFLLRGMTLLAEASGDKAVTSYRTPNEVQGMPL